jgi:adhesin transport system outer membrane protein
MELVRSALFAVVFAITASPAQSQAPIPTQATTQFKFVDLIESANLNHPGLKVARLGLLASKQDIDAIKRRRWPAVSVVAEATSTEKGIQPTQQLGLEQVLWDFGALTAKIDESERNALVTDLLVSIERRKVHLEVVNAWQSLQGALGKQQIALSVLNTLEGYKDMMARRVAAEVSPSIDLEVVHSRILATQIELAQSKTTISVSLAKLKRLTGLSELTDESLGAEFLEMDSPLDKFKLAWGDKDWTSFAERHPSVQKAKLEAEMTDLRLTAKKSEQWPQIYARITQPLDTGTGNANEQNMKSTAFLGIRYSPGAGFVTSAEVGAMATRLASAQEAVDVARHEVAESLSLDAADFESNLMRHIAQAHAVQSSKKVLESYQSQFVAGRKSWQDVLNAVRELSVSQYAEKEARIGVAGAMRRIQARAGLLEQTHEQ